MADAGAGRHHAEIVEGLLAPAQEFVAFAIALVFEINILLATRSGVPKKCPP
jgi:hypothetical protein